jgi:hypothetical protein
MLRTIFYEMCMIIYTGTEWCCEIWKCIWQKTKRMYMKQDTQLSIFQMYTFFPSFLFVCLFVCHFTYFVNLNVCVQQNPFPLVPGFALCNNCLFVEQLFRLSFASSRRFATHFLSCLHSYVE